MKLHYFGNNNSGTNLRFTTFEQPDECSICEVVASSDIPTRLANRIPAIASQVLGYQTDYTEDEMAEDKKVFLLEAEALNILQIFESRNTALALNILNKVAGGKSISDNQDLQSKVILADARLSGVQRTKEYSWRADVKVLNFHSGNSCESYGTLLAERSYRAWRTREGIVIVQGEFDRKDKIFIYTEERPLDKMDLPKGSIATHNRARIIIEKENVDAFLKTLKD
jgi:hypothetical protein